jgi:coenzyme F420-0:L-glutamate ligase/coenzyme F420-1:gamma-L-glutamate ligase
VASLHARALAGLPELHAGDDLAALIARAADDAAAAADADADVAALRDGQLVVIAHKAVSKCDGAVVSLASVEASEHARELAAAAEAATGQARDARVVQVVLDESAELVRAERGVLICRTHHGFLCANAGVDVSNAADADTVTVLPRDPDGSARAIRARLRELAGVRVGVLITDSFGRAWRNGQLDVAIGLAGMQPLEDWRGRTDARGSELRATWLAVADAAAAVGELVRAKDSNEPVVLVEGLERLLLDGDGPGAAALVRPLAEDLFR